MAVCVAVGDVAGVGDGIAVAAGVAVSGGVDVGIGVAVAVGVDVAPGVAVAVGGVACPNRTSSTTSIANAAPPGRNIARTFALCASSGASSGPVRTSTSTGAGPAIAAESTVESCAPLP